MSKRVTINDVAAASGVSRATVSLVLRGGKSISPATQQRVRKAIEKLGYVYDRSAARLRAQHSFAVGLIVTDVHNPFFAALTMATEDVLFENDYTLLIGYSHDDVERQERLISAMIERRVDGIALLPAYESTSQALTKSLDRSDTPCVLIARNVPSLGADYVGPDNVRAGVLLAEHLVGERRRSIAFLGGPVESTARHERLSGVREVVERPGSDALLMADVPSAATRSGGVDAAREVISGASSPDAVVCYNDVVAFGVMDVMRDAGLGVGHDILLGSFDNVPDASRSMPSLTSVATFPEQIGEEATRALLQRIDETEGRPRTVLVTPELIVRTSTRPDAPPP